MGRSVAALLVMLVTFAGLAALFIALDAAAGVRPQTSLLAASVRATSTPTLPAATTTATTLASSRATPGGNAAIPTGTPSGADYVRATIHAGAIGSPSSSATPAPTASASMPADATSVASATAIPATGTVTATGTITDTPPHYGTLLNYPNNTAMSPAFMQALDERIIALTNAQRTAHGLAPVSEDGQLDIIAAARSQDQIKRHYFDHYDPTGPIEANGQHAPAVRELLARDGVTYSEVGENLINRVRFPTPDMNTPQQLVDQWMQHPEHRDNILHGGYTMIGVGMAAEIEPDGLHVIVTQVFLD